MPSLNTVLKEDPTALVRWEGMKLRADALKSALLMTKGSTKNPLVEVVETRARTLKFER